MKRVNDRLQRRECLTLWPTVDVAVEETEASCLRGVVGPGANRIVADAAGRRDGVEQARLLRAANRKAKGKCASARKEVMRVTRIAPGQARERGCKP